MKVCTKCKIEKSLIEFGKDKQKKDGFTSQCKSCINKRSLKFYHSNKDILQVKGREYYYNNKEKSLLRQKEYDNLNKEKKAKYLKQWRKDNASYYKEYMKQRRKENNHIFRWRDLIWNTLTAPKQDSTQKLLGYSATQLKEHLDKQGMDWNKDHIDHKIPVSWFKKDTPPHIVNDLRNLQPLSEKENKTKLNTFFSPTEDSYIQLVKKWVKTKYLDNL
jgi:hypothetical protein